MQETIHRIEIKHTSCASELFLASGRFRQFVSDGDPHRRDGRVAEGARLESVFTRKGNVGSNPTLSASSFNLLYFRATHTTLHTKIMGLEEIWRSPLPIARR